MIKCDGFSESYLLIRNKKLKCFEGDYDVQELKFWADNQKFIQAFIKKLILLDQSLIEDVMTNKESTKKLALDIEKEGGLIEAVVVLGDSKEVIEGNRRLAAYKILNRKDPVKWAKIKVKVIVDKVEDSEVNSFLSSIHVRGKNPGIHMRLLMLYIEEKHIDGLSVSQIAEENNLKKPDTEKRIQVFKIMRDHNVVSELNGAMLMNM